MNVYLINVKILKDTSSTLRKNRGQPPQQILNRSLDERLAVPSVTG
jgi:hypothetical protein